MCRSPSDPCGKRRCNEDPEKRRARQRAWTASQRSLPPWVPPNAAGTHLPLKMSSDEGTSTKEVQDKIKEAEAVMAESDLHPQILRSNDTGHRPPRYQGPGKPVLRFDPEQGWEVATDQGEKLDQAIRSVGVGVEERALGLRKPSGLTQEKITQMQARQEEGGPSEFSHESLSEALNLHPDGPPSIFSTCAEYETYVNETLAHVSEQIERQSRLHVGDGLPDVLTYDDQPKYAQASEVLRVEQSRFLPGDGCQSAWVMHEARLDSEARLKALAEVRAIGGKYSQDAFAVPNRKRKAERQRDARVRRVVEATVAFLPRDWVEEVGRGRLLVKASENSTSVWLSPLILKRKAVGSRSPELHLREAKDSPPTQGVMPGQESDALHELGHHLEYIYPQINQIARAHKALRTTNPDGQLHEVEAILPTPGSGNPEDRPARMDQWRRKPGGAWGRPASFGAVYAGRETHPGGSEVFSTGLEAVIGGRYGALRGHGGVKADPEHLHLILGLLATVGRR